MFLDLDRFKEVNDTLGHESGDVLLREVGQRLAHSLRAGDTVARLGGDEFAVLATGLDDADDALLVARKLRQAVEWPFTLRGLTLEVEASIGIALFPEHGTDVDTLLRHADVAMYQCKEAHSGVGIYSPERDVYSPDRLKLLGELRRAIEQNELVLYYQPKISLRTSEVDGLRGARPLAAPGAGPADARAVRSVRRAHRADQAAHALRHARGGARLREVAGARASTSASPSTCPRATCSTCTCRTRSGCCSARPGIDPGRSSSRSPRTRSSATRSGRGRS